MAPLYRINNKRASFITAGIIAVLMLSGCGYNRLQQMEEDVFKAWADLEAGLQKRTDLIPSLASVAKGCVGHDKGGLARIVNARQWAASVVISVEELENREAMANLKNSQDALAAAISSLIDTLDDDPAFEGNLNCLALKDRVKRAENRIHAASQRYNQKVDLFNAAIRKFPDNLTNTFFLELKPKLHYEARTQRHP